MFCWRLLAIVANGGLRWRSVDSHRGVRKVAKRPVENGRDVIMLLCGIPTIISAGLPIGLDKQRSHEQVRLFLCNLPVRHLRHCVDGAVGLERILFR